MEIWLNLDIQAREIIVHKNVIRMFSTNDGYLTLEIYRNGKPETLKYFKHEFSSYSVFNR